MLMGCASQHINIYPSDGWHPEIHLVDDLADAFEITKAEWLSGLRITARFTGHKPFPYRIRANLYDSENQIIESMVRVWHHRVDPGETVRLNIRDLGEKSVARVEMMGIWKE